ncbi:MAG: hypothetical protein JXC36_03155 [Candidatus Atribacteria bacterium]|nr:hypothetical protein [Candidatus Atribacteria bacterium]
MNPLYQKLKHMIKKYDFLYVIFFIFRGYGYNLLNRILNYYFEKLKFYKKVGYPLQLKNPRSFHEKIIWKKIYDRNPLLPFTADKYKARSYIKNILGEEKANKILIPLLYMTDKPDTIPFESLPPNFIVKANHASGFNIIVENGHFNKEKIIKTCQRWLKIPYGLDKLEWAYQPIRRRIIIEKLLREDNGNRPRRFNFYMFHGKCKSIHVMVEGINSTLVSFFDEKWDFLLAKNPNRLQGPRIKKPKNYEDMLEIAEKLSKPFDHVRIDLYNVGEMIFFGELTHYTESGLGKFEPQSHDFELGRYWTIKAKYWKEQ